MRVIDDEVDNVFLALDEAERERRRPAMLNRLAAWRRDAARAALGTYSPCDAGEDATIFTAINETIGRGTLGRGPFDGLADALRRDAEERPLATWQEFLAYCDGAAAAPAAVFAYIVGCHVEAGGRTRWALGGDCMAYVRNLALFSYLVHILRDLRQDALRAPQHLTLPDDLLTASGLTKPALQAAARERDRERLAPLVATVAELAEGHRLSALTDLERLNRETDGAAPMLLGLAEVYRLQLEAIRADYGAVLEGTAIVDMATVDRLLAEGGVA
jgi:phytoene synthase